MPQQSHLHAVSANASLSPDDRDTSSGPGPVELRQIPVSAVVANARQPRTVFADEDLHELAASIADVGILQPIVVRPAADAEDRDAGSYELVMGERRWRAAQLAGLGTVPALVRMTADDQMLREALLENLQRVQLNPLEEAAAYQQMIDDFDCTHDEVADAVRRSRSHVTHMVGLLNLPGPVQRRVAAGVLSAGHAKELQRVKEPTACVKLADRIVAEGLSVRATAELIMLGDLPGWEDEHMKARRRARLRPPPSAELAVVAEQLGDRLDTRVKIEAGKNKGRIVVEFSDPDDMNRILQLLQPKGQQLADD